MRMKAILSFILCLCMLTTMLCVPATADEVPENGEVRLYLWVDPTPRELEAIAYAEAKYKIKVNWEVVAWDLLDSRLTTEITSGNAPDLINLHNQNFPRVAVNKLAMPASKLNQELYNHPLLAKNNAAVRNYYTYNGESYAVSGGLAPRWIFFNKTMFEDYGMDTPRELYDAGEWNWDTFRQSALDIMEYDAEGNVAVWGFGSWVYDLWIISNGGSLVENMSEGGVRLTLDDPKAMRGLQFMQDGYFKDKYFNPTGHKTHTTDFVSGKCAMIADGMYRASEFATMKDEWDFVPVPVGPDNTAGTLPGNCDGWAVTVGAKNPDGALMYLIGTAEYYEENPVEDSIVQGFSEAQKALYDEYVYGDATMRIESNRLEGIGNMKQLQWNWWEQIFFGLPIATVNAIFGPVFQAEIDAMMSK